MIIKRVRRSRSTVRLTAVGMVAVAVLAAGCSSSSKSNASPATTAAPASGGSVSPSGHALYPAPSSGNGGATATGVTANSVNLALIYSVTGPAPGVTAGNLRGAQAYIDYINSIGGIYGRQLHLTAFDDGFDPTKAKAACTQAAGSYFAITGGFSIGDAGCYPVVQSSGIPWVQFYYDNQFESLPNAVQAGTGNIYQEPDTAEVALKSQFPGVTKVASLYEATPGNSQETTHINAAIKKAGFDVVLTEGLNDTAPSFANYVVQLRNSGAQAIFMDASSSFSQSRLAQAMTQQNFHPKFVEAATAYASNWHQLAGAGAAGWTSDLTYQPFLNQAAMNSTPGSRLFLKWFNQVNPGKAIDLFAVYGWTSTALAVQGMINAGADLTRASVMKAINGIHNWTANGVLAPSDVGNRGFATCINLEMSTATGYTQLLPKTAGGGFDCSVPGASVLSTPGNPS